MVGNMPILQTGFEKKSAKIGEYAEEKNEGYGGNGRKRQSEIQRARRFSKKNRECKNPKKSIKKLFIDSDSNYRKYGIKKI